MRENLVPGIMTVAAVFMLVRLVPVKKIEEERLEQNLKWVCLEEERN